MVPLSHIRFQILSEIGYKAELSEIVYYLRSGMEPNPGYRRIQGQAIPGPDGQY